jgi:hypothetical protein
MEIEKDFGGVLEERETLTKGSKHCLMETAKWSSYFGIVGFIGAGLMAIFSLFAGTMFSSLSKINPAMSSMPGAAGTGFSAMITFVYLLLALLYFFPSLYLFKSGKALKAGLKMDDPNQIEEGLKNMKSNFKFWGIFSIIIIAIYGLIFLIGMAGAAFS